MRNSDAKPGMKVRVREPEKWENGPHTGIYDVIRTFTKPGYAKVWCVVDLNGLLGTLAASDLKVA